jgi:hypothetical protein
MKVKETRSSMLARPLALTATVVLVGGVAIATGAIPSGGTGEVHFCFQKAAAKEKGGAEVRVFDAEATPDACAKGDRELVMNQQGTQGPTGPTGPPGGPGAQGATGPAGPSAVYNASPGDTVIVNSDEVVASTNVPAGSYAISASLEVINGDDDDRAFVYCDLRAGGNDLAFYPQPINLPGDAGDDGDTEHLAMNGVASGFAGGAIDLQCEEVGPSDKVTVILPVLNAIKVDSVH